MKIEDLEKLVTVQLDIENEDIDPKDQLGDPEHAEILAEVYERLERGDLWAWCIVKVTVSFEHASLGTIKSTQYLSGCSYRNSAEFKQPGDYYTSMVHEGCLELLAEINGAVETATGEMFTLTDHHQLACLIFKRLGQDRKASEQAWRTLLHGTREETRFAEFLDR